MTAELNIAFLHFKVCLLKLAYSNSYLYEECSEAGGTESCGGRGEVWER